MTMKLFTNAFLFDCTGADPVEKGWVLTEDDVIRETGDGKPPSPPDAEILDCRGLTLLPGLIDAHIHVSLYDNDLGNQHRAYYPAMHYVKAMAVLKDTLDQGFTTVRDAGGADAGFRVAVEQGLITGPSITVCGSSLCITGGHADCRYSTEQRPPVFGPFTSSIADGVPEVQKAAREQLRQGVDYIKVMAGGGCASQADEPDTVQYTPAEMEAIVYEASAVGKKVLAHCYSNNSMRLCANAGVYSIEHGNYLDSATAKLIKDKGCWLVPTLSTYFFMSDNGEKLGIPGYFLRKMKQVREHALEAVKIAMNAGLNIGSGSDMVGDGQAHKNMEIELKSRVMGARKAILSATRENSRLIFQEDKIGTIEAGKRADMILVDGKPLEKPEAFKNRDNIKVILLRGNLYKNIL
ncbi:MAG: amidohydrolase family protein [Synergistaceae bacterium]|jgi:imidazolonepropionase-like amidohydrolase|nr:amidohydrolase family protein [Synergistaceae bacterium]